VNFVHVSLLAGVALAVVPLLLHLLGKREPKQITFPALRFVRATAVQAQRGWNIKRWLLLFLRMLLLVVAAVALASPRVHSSMHATYVMLGVLACLAILASAIAFFSLASRHPRWLWQSLVGLAVLLWLGVVVGGGLAWSGGVPAPSQSTSGPICMAIVIDTSPTMDYRHADITRLEAAKETARWLMDRLPGDSQIAIVSSTQGQRLHPSRISANRQLENVKLEGVAADLPERIQAAIALVQSSSLARREVYVLTDMASPAWSGASGAQRDMFGGTEEREAVLLQLIDVGTVLRDNWSLVNLKLSQETLVSGGAVEVSATVQATASAPASQLGVELWVEQRDPRLPVVRNGEVVLPASQVVDRQTVDVPAGGLTQVNFSLPDIGLGPTHAWLRLTRPDPLEIDNRLAFTVEGIAPGKQLVVGASEGRDQDRAKVAAQMLDPEGKVVDFKTYRELDTLELGAYEAILLVDPPALNEAAVARLQAAVESGRGLMLILGRQPLADESWQSAPVVKLLPGGMRRLWRRPFSDSSHYFESLRPEHPIWTIYDQQAKLVPWNRFPVHKYWLLQDLAADATPLLRYTQSGHPAMIEQPRGAGRIVTMTTPMTDEDSTEDPPWNRLWAAPDAWPNFGLLVGTMRYLSGMAGGHRNFVVGSMPVLDNPSERYPARYDLFTPTAEVVRLQTPGSTLTYAYATWPGVYRLRSAQADKPAMRGFSMQLDPKMVRLDPIDPAKLDDILGKDRYFLVKDREHLQTSIGQARHGKELAPFFLVVLIILGVAEQAMSYRFYALGTRAAP
jgi:hypothetical protein